MCVSVRNSCKRSSDWFPSFDRHLTPLGRWVGQGEGPAVGDERFWGWEVFKQAFVHGWALTLPPFFLSVSLPSPFAHPPSQAGAYYPAQGVQQFPTGVAPAPVLMNQPPQIAPKRERKTVSSSKGLWDIWERENQGQTYCGSGSRKLRKEIFSRERLENGDLKCSGSL